MPSKGGVPWNKGKTKEEYPQLARSPETLQKMSIGIRASNPTRIPNLSKSRLGRHFPKLSQAKKGLSSPYIGLKRTPEHCRNISLAKKGKRPWNYGVTGYHNKPYPQSFYDSRWKGLVTQKPNKSEIKLGELIEIACPKEYSYTGNGSFIIQRCCPDFSNTNGQKKVIEMYGDYWHSAGSDKNRIEKFKSFGYDCLVIWESELKEKPESELITKISEFNRRKVCQ